MTGLPRYYKGVNLTDSALLNLLGFLEEKAWEWADREKYVKRLSRSRSIPHRQTVRVERPQWERTVKRLEARGVLERRKIGGRLMVRLTEAGLRQLWRTRIKLVQSRCPNNEWCIVVFDIPEEQRLARRTFRYFLKECGFVQLQRSVWACDRMVTPELLTFVQSLHLEPWVHVITGHVHTLSKFSQKKH